MLTAKTQEQDIVRALSAGANDYVLKPFQPAELLARIKRLSLHRS
ncbi:MAG: response regulator [Polaromonas sp.]